MLDYLIFNLETMRIDQNKCTTDLFETTEQVKKFQVGTLGRVI